MIPFSLKLASPRRTTSSVRVGPSLREALALLCDRPVLDHIREPEGLEHPMAARSRRLMRTARVCGG